ncbi:MAG: 5-formyltetrahydrofolate cyclo-ligase [Candidatus Tectomicrobia bacterium]|uniref:5-formyltetrahydrofolate cyclo-ligase n=1 Tax=Tectimicrobiota bacterium TaxID=2528274 RepID=A0A933GLB8_UNCTE|nr:5-formyltetrahydrofolate cyclo-ligase [Candidatus Tectomicrobia bacterium]
MKKELRAGILNLRDGMPLAIRNERSSIIEKKLLSLPQYTISKTLMSFCSFGSEVNTERIIKHALESGKRVAVPKVSLKNKSMLISELNDYEKDLVSTPPYGILEPSCRAVRPVNPMELDLIIMPGVVFDREGGRIGYGAGFYDRFLEKVPENVCRMAIAFDLQLVNKLPKEPHDKLVDILVTEKEILHFNLRSIPKD